MFLQTGRGYTEEHALYINSAYFIATDVGCLMAGAGALWLVKRGWNVHRSRLAVYATCSLLSTLTLVAAVLPKGPLLIAVLLTVGAGLLGLFPCYYSFTQELSANRVGKATGLLSFLGWLIPSPLQRAFGQYVDKTGSFDFGIAVIGLAPLLGLLAMLILWRNEDKHSLTES
jgi:ACS family hexuronate transporter-like MFS transporter